MPDKTNNYIISTLENDGILSNIRSRLKLNILNILSDKYPKNQKYNDEKKEKILSSELNMASLSFAFDLLKSLGLNLTNSLLLTEINSDKIYYERNSLAAKFGLQLSNNEPLLFQLIGKGKDGSIVEKLVVDVTPVSNLNDYKQSPALVKTASPVYESSPRSTEKPASSPRYQSPSPSGSEETQNFIGGIATKGLPGGNKNNSPGVKSNEKSPASRSPPGLTISTSANASASATSPTSLNTSYSSSPLPSPSSSSSPSSSANLKRSVSKLSSPSSSPSPTSPSQLAGNKVASSFYTEPLDEPVSPQQQALLQAEADMAKALQSHPAFSNHHENKSESKLSSASDKYSIFQQVLDSNEFKQKSGQNNSPTTTYSNHDAMNVVRVSTPESPTIAEILSEEDNPENPEESFMTEISDNISDTQSSNENMNLKDRIPEYQSIYGSGSGETSKAKTGVKSLAVTEMKQEEQEQGKDGEEKKETLGRANIRRIGQARLMRSTAGWNVSSSPGSPGSPGSFGREEEEEDGIDIDTLDNYNDPSKNSIPGTKKASNKSPGSGSQSEESFELNNMDSPSEASSFKEDDDNDGDLAHSLSRSRISNQSEDISPGKIQPKKVWNSSNQPVSFEDDNQSMDRSVSIAESFENDDDNFFDDEDEENNFDLPDDSNNNNNNNNNHDDGRNKPSSLFLSRTQSGPLQPIASLPTAKDKNSISLSPPVQQADKNSESSSDNYDDEFVYEEDGFSNDEDRTSEPETRKQKLTSSKPNSNTEADNEYDNEYSQDMEDFEEEDDNDDDDPNNITAYKNPGDNESSSEALEEIEDDISFGQESDINSFGGSDGF